MCVALTGRERQHRARLLTFGPSIAASAVTFGLILWFMFELNSREFGLAERCAAVAPALWLFPVAYGARRAFVPAETVELDGGSQVPEVQEASWISGVNTNLADAG